MQPQPRADLDKAAPRAAQLRFYAGILCFAVLLHLSTGGINNRIFLLSLSTGGTGGRGAVLDLQLCLRPVVVLGAGLVALYFLRSDYKDHVRAAELGCKPAPRYPRYDVLGIRFLLETARLLKENVMLQKRKELLEECGYTFVHGVFPDGGVCITTAEPENVRAVLCTGFADWDVPRLRIRGFLPVLGRHSIFTTNGAEWQHSRAILRPAFVRDQISDLACVDRHVRKLIARIPTDGTTVFDLQALFSMLTTDTISDFMFGQSTDLLGNAPEDSHRFGNYFDQAMAKIAWRARLGWLTMLRRDPELDTYATFLRKFVTKYVTELRAREEGNKEWEVGKYVFLNELLKSGESDEVICDHLLSIFTAGRDTTTSVLSYLFFELSRRPDIAATIRAEIAELGSEDPTWEQLRGMRYLNWVLKEALRLNPPVATNTREAVRDTVLPRGGGPDGKSPVFVRKGTSIRYVPWIMHRRTDIFGEDADEFRPERWEDLRVTLEYLPFNAGPRICIGQQFALTQMALITLRLLQAFKTIERRDDRPPIQKLGINLSMLYGCQVSVTPA
ncbi:cytochrome P450 52E2 [Xylaria cubensis]|nr:cytochrome P450 52E2 [Xylaria cubensis]